MPFANNHGVAIHYRVEGVGPALVLQHGFTDSSDSWYELGYVDALKSKYRLILIDMRGHGQSDKPHDPLAYTPAKFAADCVAVLDQVGIQKTYYWGFSLGGWIAFALARHASARVSAFVVGGASATAATPYPIEPGQEDPLLALLRRGPNEVAKLYGEWLTPAIETRYLKNDSAALIACRQQRLVTEGYADVVGKITQPLLLYVGTADPIHDAAKNNASQIRGAEFVAFPGVGHVAVLCQSGLILPHVERFLEKAGGR
jgi:pimeloyl-ACP methyl ester carboxylesterase